MVFYSPQCCISMLKHVGLADAAVLAADAHICVFSLLKERGIIDDRDILLAMSYGLYPFGVHETSDGMHLSFRRMASATDNKDKQRRMTEAVEALSALPAVQRYNANLQDPVEELHVHTGTLHVLWPLQSPTATMHAEVIPELITWTSWTANDQYHNDDWAKLRRYTYDFSSAKKIVQIYSIHHHEQDIQHVASIRGL